MKAVTAVCPTTGATVASGRVIRQHRRDVENEEIQMYLSKLKDLVPFMPKNRKLTKLEVIQNVIDYICDLQTALESHPAVNTANGGFDAAAALRNTTTTTTTNNIQSNLNSSQYHHNTINSQHRQPLGVLPTPNTILPASPSSDNNSSTNSTSGTTTVPLIPIPEKLSPTDGRPISC